MLQMKNITKYFCGLRALENVDLSIGKGEVHALIGENGAGKSTLMKILSGAYKRDNGEIYINGDLAKINTPKDATDLGVSVIYQEFMLAPDLTVAENIFIDKLTEGKKTINWKKLKNNAREQLKSLGFEDIDPSTRVEELSVAYRQVVEICKCLTRNSKILVFDEPTAVLTFTEIEKLFSIIEKLKSEGTSIIYISHRLEEIFRICDKITVLKDGGIVDTVNAKDIDKETLVNMMVGRELTELFPIRNADIKETVMKVSNLKTNTIVENVSFEVKAGEVLGFSGLVGAGRTEVMRAIFGVDKIISGEVVFLDSKVRFKGAKDSIKNGFGLLPEDRKNQGLILEQSIRMNTTLTVLDKVTNKFGIINHKKEKEYVRGLLKEVSTKYGKLEDHVNSLSGGNQQKIAISKWIATDCKCLVLDEPTRGVDVGAKTEIYGIINKLAEKGIAIIIISSEMPEIIGMCDRVVVMRQGYVSGELLADEITENNLIRLAMGV